MFHLPSQGSTLMCANFRHFRLIDYQPAIFNLNVAFCANLITYRWMKKNDTCQWHRPLLQYFFRLSSGNFFKTSFFPRLCSTSTVPNSSIFHSYISWLLHRHASPCRPTGGITSSFDGELPTTPLTEVVTCHCQMVERLYKHPSISCSLTPFTYDSRSSYQLKYKWRKIIPTSWRVHPEPTTEGRKEPVDQ